MSGFLEQKTLDGRTNLSVVAWFPDHATTEGERRPSSRRTPASTALLLMGFSLAYFVATLLLADRKLLWTDEIVTFYLFRLPTAADQ